jgi:hypothetical protein
MFSRYSSLFMSLLLLIVMLSFDEGGDLATVLTLVLFSLVAVAGVFVAAEKRSSIVVSLVLGVPWLAVAWLQLAFHTEVLGVATLVLAVLFLGQTVFLILKHLVSARRVTGDLLFGAGNVYLMIGVIWALLYALLQIFEPAAFQCGACDGPLGFETIVYYSFTTLTTLGYGDISPASSFARSLAILEAITGVLYTTILVARLMGVYLAGFLGDKKNQ